MKQNPARRPLPASGLSLRKRLFGHWPWLLGGASLLLAIIGTSVFAYGQLRDSAPRDYTKAIAMGGEWFLRNQNDQFLRYEYQPVYRRHTDDHHRLREMGAMWALAKLGSHSRDDRYTQLAKKGFAFFETSFKTDRQTGGLFVNIEPDEIKLAYNAFALLTLLELKDAELKKYFEPLKRGMLSQQQPNGEFKTLFFSDRRRSVDYYPGEALFALMSLHQQAPDPKIIEAAEKALPYYHEYWRGNKNTGFVPWQARANSMLYVATGNTEARDFVFEMSDWLLAKVGKRQNACDHFRFGGITAAVYVEGMTSAHAAAQKAGDTKRATCYANFVREGADFIARLQIDSEKPYGPPAFGGFLSKAMPPDPQVVPRDRLPTLRVDNNQHAVVALIEAKEAGIIE